MYYASIGVLSLIIHVIINYEALKKPQNTSSVLVRDRYRMFLYGVMVFYISDILWGSLYERRLIVLTYIDTSLFFLSMVVSVLFWTRFVVAYLNTKGLFSRILIFSGWIILLYEIIVLIVNLFIPVVYGFSEDKEYLPGQARYITLIIQMFLFLATSIYAFVTSFKVGGEEKFNYRTVGLSGLFMTFFIAIQSLYPLMPFYSIGCLLATCIIHSFVYKDMASEYKREIEIGKQIALKDPLTGVKNKRAYLNALVDIDTRLSSGELSEYGVMVFDLNGLKLINDTQGHDAGDEYIKNACRMICLRYKHSPVFRIGGDEFVAILEGGDYKQRDVLLAEFDQTIEDNQRNGNVVVASGMAVYDPEIDENYNDVFKRADKNMYQRKDLLKNMAI